MTSPKRKLRTKRHRPFRPLRKRRSLHGPRRFPDLPRGIKGGDNIIRTKDPNPANSKTTVPGSFAFPLEPSYHPQAKSPRTNRRPSLRE
ncbi:hypothetical protein TREAZ_0391 [Leadbettera azotonutricia ZAS-9]|uniref:Uncharacterized protein n=1 Tax=Leadbettera azotonutricia (strain ATCC BAA-888 / DSM 13862 / ZAS-9) TaxID=545695 RepID=F5YCY1_LEAAZ|nr:hypothetical protein TREAZ_0391 [Leadbettera azotonutricia ZAS-9]